MAALEQAGIPHKVLRKDPATGILQLELQYPIEGDTLKLHALFPAEFEFFPVLINAPDLDLPRHQDPIIRNLCMLANPARDWDVNELVAELLARQLSKVLAAGRSPEGELTAEIETHLGEPWSAYVRCKPGYQLVVGDLRIPGDVSGGKLIWAKEKGIPVRGALLEVQDRDGKTLAEVEPWIRDRYKGCEILTGKWKRVEGKPCISNPVTHFESIYPQNRKREKPRRFQQMQLAGTIFSEEVQWRDRRDGWVFSVCPPHQRNAASIQYLRPAYAHESAFFARIPELAPLRDKRVVVVGLGMLGSPAVLEFARAGIGTLTICDGDFVELGTITRWGAGWDAGSCQKAEFLASYVRAQYPYVKIESIDYRIGDPYAPQAHRDALEFAIKESDLVFDAAADACVSNYLRTVCLRLGKQHVWLEANPGCWGGVVGRYLPGRTGCWACMKFHQDDKLIPIPSHLQEGDVQPEGCRMMTSTGAGFDSGEVVLQGVRTVAGNLCEGVSGGYPFMDWDVAVLQLRPDDGSMKAPSWTVYPLRTHAKCNHD